MVQAEMPGRDIQELTDVAGGYLKRLLEIGNTDRVK
jgi:hypothetical protein